MSPNAVRWASRPPWRGIEQIRKSAPEGRGFELYVVDDHRHWWRGALRRLLTARHHTDVGDPRSQRRQRVAETTRRVAQLVAKYDWCRCR